MGERGATQSTRAAETADELVDAFQPLGHVRSKRMFGGFGVFADDVMFALVDTTGQGFLRVDDNSRPRFDEAGANAHGRMPYWSIPDDVRAHEETLVAWGRDALEVARAAKR